MSPSSEQGPLHELDPTGRFSRHAVDYARYRPSYPDAAIAAVLEGLGAPDSLAAVDVGAGTGIAARQLAARGVRVEAVEPNAAMRAAAVPHPRVLWREGTAEATGLRDATADLVVVAQAFHWFRAAAALSEFHRVLRPRGRLALIWNTRDDRDPLTRDYHDAIRTVIGEHAAMERAFDPRVVAAGGEFAAAALTTFPHAQELDREGLIGRAASASYVPSEDPAPLEALTRLLDRVFDRHRDAHGRVRLVYVTELYLATSI